jgi:predicted PurR-regulated permease PerM
MRDTAKRAFVFAGVFIAVIALALALWKLKLVISLIFFAFIIAAAMRPGVDALHRRRIPRAAGIGIHYAVLLAIVGLFFWQVLPQAINQVSKAAGNLPTSKGELHHAATHSSGVKHDVFNWLDKHLKKLPSGGDLVHPAITLTRTLFEVLVGIFFVFACAAYWIFEREKAEEVVLSLVPKAKRRVVRDTWNLIDLKLGAFVRGQLLLVTVVAVVLGVAYWAIGLPYWLLLAIFAGVVESVPVVGPLSAGIAAVGVGLTVSWHLALEAAAVVLVVRLLEDYLVLPRILGGAVGLSPLLVLIAVSIVGVVLGPFYVLISVPLASLLVTVMDVVVRDVDPAEAEVPTVLFSAKETET